MLRKKQKKNSKFHPPERSIFAYNFINAGDFIVYTQTLKDCYEFIILPGPSTIYITFEDFENALKNNVLSFVEQLPEDVYKETLELANSSRNLLSCPQSPIRVKGELTYEKQDTKTNPDYQNSN